MACSHRTPSSVPRSSRARLLTPLTLHPHRARRHSRPRCQPVSVGLPVPQARLRYRPGALPELRRRLNDRRRHLRAHLGLAPGTAPSRGQGLRSIPAGLIPPDPRSHPVQPLSRSSPFALARPRPQNALPNIAPRAEEGPENAPIPGRGLACLTAHELSSTLPLDKKGRLKSLFFLFHCALKLRRVLPISELHA